MHTELEDKASLPSFVLCLDDMPFGNTHTVSRGTLCLLHEIPKDPYLKAFLPLYFLLKGAKFRIWCHAVAVETGEEMDRDLWMLVEELRDQNRKLIEEVQGLQKNGVPVSNS